jgi:hypothetical protein
MRLVFTWKNDAVNGTEPPAALDDVSLISSVPTIPLSGRVAIGPTGAFPTLTAANNALLNQGQSGPIYFELLSSYTSASETFPIVLGPIC